MHRKRPFTSETKSSVESAVRLLTIWVALYGLVWISLEGALPQVLLLGGSITAVLSLRLLLWLANGRWFVLWQWLLLLAALGLLAGVLLVVSTFFLMGLKTGLHAHGPEFTPQEIVWLWRQLPLWTTVGFLTGLGVSLLSWSTLDAQPRSENLSIVEKKQQKL